jgi:hypothetical protein
MKTRTHMALLGILLLAPALPACQGSPDDGDAPLTYYRDVKVLLDANCIRCHVDGGIGPFPLTSYAEAYPYRARISEMVANKLMPPWLAGEGCADYKGDFSLSDAAIATITGWVRTGAPEGDPAEEPAPMDVERITMSRVDMSLPMPETYTPQIQPDDYRCFIIDWPEQATTFVSGFRARPGEVTEVHHVVVNVVEAAADIATVRALDDAEPGPGYTCFGGSGVTDRNVGLWVPGNDGSDYPDGTGLRVEPGSVLVLQIHYNTIAADPVPDLTTLDFKLESAVDKEAYMVGWLDVNWVFGDNMLIPAGASDVWYSFTGNVSELIGIPLALDIYSARMHMHTLGTYGNLSIVHPAGDRECLLDVPAWDFHWQNNYTFSAPHRLAADDDLYVECHWDNTADNQPLVDGVPRPVQDVRWGEGTTDEMCIGLFYVTLP